MSEPTLEQKWIEVLEWAGWKRHEGFITAWGAEEPIKCWHLNGVRAELPPMSLEAVHQMIGKLTPEQRRTFGEQMCDVVPSKYGFHLYIKTPWTGEDVCDLVAADCSFVIDALWRTAKG